MQLKYLSFKYHITVIKALIICTKYLNINKLVSNSVVAQHCSRVVALAKCSSVQSEVKCDTSHPTLGISWKQLETIQKSSQV